MMNDAVSHPAHYTDGKYETIDFIESWGLGFHLGNAVKYISRAGKKDPAKKGEDLQKALWYLHRYEGLKNKPNKLYNGETISIMDYCKDKGLAPRLSGAMTAILADDIPDAIDGIETFMGEEKLRENY